MRLKKLEIYGFKSFAQRTEIVFNQGITGIVGPNGSGKSNIADAVRWVLGEQSARLLRGAKMEDIIFGGTEKRKAMAYCEVSLVFDNEDKSLPVDYVELMVTRRVYRNGESEYYLNKAACRLKDVVDLFRDTGIGREGYSIIGQGRIDEILSQKGEDRRQVFEDAAGIMKYRARKEEAERKLERTRENLTRVEDILDELSRHLEPLAKQAETARAYLMLAEQLKGLELNIFLIRHDKLKERLNSLMEAAAGVQAVLDQNTARLEEKTQLRREMEDTLEHMEADLLAAREQLTRLNDEWHEEKSNREKVNQRLENSRENSQRLQDESSRLDQRYGELSAMESSGEGGLNTQEEALKQGRETLVSEQEQLRQFQLEEADREQELEEHKAAILAAMNRLSNERTAQTRQQAIMAQMKERLAELLKSQADLSQKETALESAYQKAVEQGEATRQSWKELSKEAESLDARVQSLGASIGEKTTALQQSAGRQQAMESRLKLLEEMERAYEGYAQAVKKALTYAKNQGDNKVRGVVAMLMRVPKHMETAVDMVLGGALQNIITEDEPTAKRVIEYLRNNQLGRATFLPMNTIRGRVLTREERSLLTMPGCLGVASELISFDPEYREIMENLLGRTVVAENLDAGIAIMRAGRQAFRLVTLNGDVMHSGGSMTGGSVQARAASLLGREREIEELRVSSRKLMQELQSARQALEEMEKERAELKTLRNEAIGRVHQEEIAVARDQERVTGARQEWDALKSRLQMTLSARQQLEEGIVEIEEDLEAISRRTGDVETDQEAMQQKTQSLQQALISARLKVEKQRDTVTQHMLAVTGREHEIASLKRDRQRLLEEVKNAGEDLNRLRKEMAAVQESILRDEAALESLEESVLGRHQAVTRAQAGVDEMESKRLAQQSALRTLRDETESLQKEAADLTEKLHRTELNRTRVEADLTAMQERIWNEYELTYGGAEAYRAERFDLSAGEKEASFLKEQIRALGTVNVNSIEEYVSTKERFDSLTTQQQDLKKAEEDLGILITKLLGQMEQQFVVQFNLMKGYFSETFVRLFGGGHAELSLTDESDALNCGIEISAQPPGKKLQLLSLLSGGERALTAIAILFAMLKLKPTPFCILDEIEAALDEANINYFADYLSEYGKKTQFVVVTHRKGTMERCNALYGVAMEERGISKMVSVNLTEYAG